MPLWHTIPPAKNSALMNLFLLLTGLPVPVDYFGTAAHIVSFKADLAKVDVAGLSDELQADFKRDVSLRLLGPSSTEYPTSLFGQIVVGQLVGQLLARHPFDLSNGTGLGIRHLFPPNVYRTRPGGGQARRAGGANRLRSRSGLRQDPFEQQGGRGEGGLERRGGGGKGAFLP